MTSQVHEKPVVLPDLALSPSAAAHATLENATVRPGDASRLRISQLLSDIDNDLDKARTDTKYELKRFAVAVATKLKAIIHTEARLYKLDSGFIPPPRDVAVDTLALIRAVARWKNGNLLRSEIAAAIKRLEPTLARVESTYAGLQRGEVPALPQQIAREHRASMLDSVHDELERRATDCHTQSQAVSATLKALGTREDRAKAVAAALAAAGRPKVIAAVEPSRKMVDSSAPIAQRIYELTGQIHYLDPETRRHAELSGERERLEAEVQSTTASVNELRRQAAEQLIQAAESGNLDAIGELEMIVAKVLPALADQLTEARGNDQQLAFIVGELIKPTP